MKTIDFENHFFVQELLDSLEKRKYQDFPWYDPEKNVFAWTPQCMMNYDAFLSQLMDFDKRIEAMDRNGVDIAVLSSAHGFEQLEEDGPETCRKINDALQAAIEKHPGRFLGTAQLPVTDPDAACSELERVVKDYGFVGWHTHSNYGPGKPSIEDKKFWPIIAKAQELGIYIYLHPHTPSWDRLYDQGLSIITAGLGFTLDTMTTLVRILTSGLLDEYPDTKLMVGHYGEALPFLLERMENRFKYMPNPKVKCKEDLRHYFEKNIFVTTSGNMSDAAFECSKDVLGMDHVLVGTDYPFEKMDDMMDYIKALPLADEERAQLHFENAQQFGISE